MPPKKKKQPRNAFYFFMIEWKALHERQGQRFRDLKEVSELCSDEWKRLPAQELKRFKMMENAAKGKDKSDLSNKFNSLGKSFQEISHEKLKEQTSYQKMCADLDNLLPNKRDLLMNQCFFLVHTNVYCYWTQEQVYIPCEVAISKFSLKDGVLDTYNAFPLPYTNEGKIPLGYKFEVQQNSQTVHGIPEPSEFSELQCDWPKIRSDIHNFLRRNGEKEIPPVFTMDIDDPNINCHITAVKNFFDLVANDTIDEFRVFSLSLLFFNLYKKCQLVAGEEFEDDERAFPVEGVAHQQLLKDIYNFDRGISCEFHETTDRYHNCSLSFVIRWVYIICEFCCIALRIELIPGRHCLSSAQINIPWNKEPQKQQPTPKQSSQTSTSVPRSSNFSNDVHSSKIEHLTDEDSDDGGGAWCTVSRAQHQMKSLELGNEKVDDGRSDGAWGTTSSPHHKLQKHKVEDKEVLFIDSTKMPDPTQMRVMRTGQSPNVVSVIMPDSVPPSVRLPTTIGRGESMARALNQHLSAGASFSLEDFPAMGASKPGKPGQSTSGRLAKPLAAGWGRGFLKQ